MHACMWASKKCKDQNYQLTELTRLFVRVTFFLPFRLPGLRNCEHKTMRQLKLLFYQRKWRKSRYFEDVKVVKSTTSCFKWKRRRGNQRENLFSFFFLSFLVSKYFLAWGAAAPGGTERESEQGNKFSERVRSRTMRARKKTKKAKLAGWLAGWLAWYLYIQSIFQAVFLESTL